LLTDSRKGEDAVQEKKKLWLVLPATIVVFLVVVAAVAFFGLEYYATNRVKQEINKHIQEVSKHVQVEYDSLGVNWLAFTVYLKKVKLTKPPLPGSITIDKIKVRDLTSIGIKWIPTLVVLDNISCKANDNKIDAKRLSTRFSLNRIPTQEEISQDNLIVLKNLLAGDVKIEGLSFADDKWQLQIGNIETGYTGKNANVKSSDLKINNLKLQREDIKINLDAFTFGASLDQKNVITHISKNMKNFSLKFPPDLGESDDFFGKLTALGYDQLAFDFGVIYDFKPKTKELRTSWDGSAKNMGRFKVNIHWEDVHIPPVPLAGSLAQFLSFLEQVKNAPLNAGLLSLKADYHDLGLTPKLIKAQAQARGVSAEDFTQNLVGNLNALLLIIPLPAKVKEQVKAVNRFIQKPNEIHLGLVFKKPLHLKQLEEGSLDRLFTLFENTEVTITAN
jgi:hypothetical protein